MQEVQKDGVNDVMSKNNFIASTTPPFNDEIYYYMMKNINNYHICVSQYCCINQSKKFK